MRAAFLAAGQPQGERAPPPPSLGSSSPRRTRLTLLLRPMSAGTRVRNHTPVISAISDSRSEAMFAPTRLPTCITSHLLVCWTNVARGLHSLVT